MLRILFDPGNLNNEEIALILKEKFKDFNVYKNYDNREGIKLSIKVFRWLKAVKF